MTRVAAIDCGTNSIRLLVADLLADGSLVDVLRRMEVVRLGYGVDRTGAIAPEAMARTLAMCAEYAGQCRELGARRVRFVATSASRDARNAAEFVAGVEAAFGDYGVQPEVVSGTVEAELSFAGATGDVTSAGFPAPILAVDLGGGSTELVRGRGRVEQGWSMDVGCVRMTERHLRSDPPTSAEIAAARQDIAAALDEAEQVVDLSGLGTVVGLAGSITTVTAQALGLPAYDSVAIHLAEVGAQGQQRAAEELLAMSRAQRAALPYMHPGRVDVIGAGALVWHEVLNRVLEKSPQVRVVTSEHDILDGIALSLADRAEVDPA
jgi:exopolyphosphatase/guanosine-5'-triphosphate,3'-diphosphate pyrophosphatase